MQLDEFRRYINRDVNAVDLTGNWILFKLRNKSFELWNQVVDRSVYFKTLDEALDHTIDGKSIRQYIDEYKPMPRIIDGGRGSANGNREFRFTSASDGRGKDKTHSIHAAYMNTATKERSVEGAIKAFGDKYRNADHEYGATVDNLGYTYNHVEGNQHSVNIHGDRGKVILHNHPSGGNFSKADMQVIARGREKGIVASGKHGDYVFMKGSHFDSAAFEKAINKARPRGKNYDDAIGKWLKANQEKYGYTYSFNKLKTK